ncbi:hypothetical protein ACIBCM_18670 [Streptomyces sp. NPDC051018]|uniref:hypothetical protein n=1 Tax=Streptomyces sp. NPDC051018 TaxID=3365639 RepID=UPI0037950701
MRVPEPSSGGRQIDLFVYFDDELLVGVELDAVQDSFPWYGGTVVDGPALEGRRDFVEAFHAADLEFDYCPHHPDEGPYEETDLAGYVEALTRLHGAEDDDDDDADQDDPWTAPWQAADPARLEGYLRFLDHRRWRVVNRSGEIVVGVPLPPGIDLQARRFSFRP